MEFFMKKIIFGIMTMLSLFSALTVCAEADKATVDTMAQFDLIIAEIKGLPDAIDGDLCAGDWSSYRKNMTKLAQKIIEANTVIKEVKLSYPIDLWTIYNRISANPVCGVGKRAMDAFGVADVSRITNEEVLGLRINEDLCPCWNIITGREEMTGFMKDGACRCTFGQNALNPNIGINEE